MSVVLLIFLIAFAIQIGYFLFIFAHLLKPSKSVNTSSFPFITVIICAKNAAKELQRNLPSILEQRYFSESNQLHFEVLVVNDFSTDETMEVLNNLQTKYAHLQVIQTDQKLAVDFGGKKAALQTAQRFVKSDFCLFTDADCSAYSENWISEMAQYIQNQKIVAGFGAYAYQKGLLNAFIRFETLHTFVQYAGMAKAGFPYMFVGRNVMYQRSLLEAAQNNTNWKHLPYGDDDLLLHGNEKCELNIADEAASKTVSEAPATWQAWFHQKQRHVSTGKYYKKGVKLALSGYALSHHLTWILGIYLGIILSSFAWLLLIRCVLFWILWKVVATRMKEKPFSFWLPFLDVGWIFYHLLLSPFIFLQNKQQWKK